MNPSQENIEEIDQNSASSRGKPPLHYINEQFFDDSNEKTSFLYIGV